MRRASIIATTVAVLWGLSACNEVIFKRYFVDEQGVPHWVADCRVGTKDQGGRTVYQTRTDELSPSAWQDVRAHDFKTGERGDQC